MIEFASNVATSAFIELFVFMTNYEYKSRMSFDSSNSTNVAQERLTIKKRVLTQKDVFIVEKMKNIWKFIKKKLINAQQNQKRHADHKRDISSKYKEEHMIWLSIKNIKTKRSLRKLNHKWIESYKIKKVLKSVCQLDLSSSMKIHDTFYISLLRSASSDSFNEQIQSSSFSIVINEEEEYEINDILNSRYHYDKLQYKIAWIDHSSDRAWFSAENFQNHSKEILNDYHQRYFQKIELNLRLIIIIEAMLSQWIKNEHKETKQLIQNVFNKMKTNMNDQKRFSKNSFEINVLARKESRVSAY
jgi:hypothetical protein